jgi:hypothetical protein
VKRPTMQQPASRPASQPEEGPASRQPGSAARILLIYSTY